MPNGEEYPLRRYARSLSALTLLVAFALVPGCSGDDGPTEPSPSEGAYRIDVVSPNGPEGAALLEVAGDLVAGVEGLGSQAYVRPVEGGARVLVLVSTPGELVFRLELEDAAARPDVELLQVVSPENRPRDLSGYSVEVTRE